MTPSKVDSELFVTARTSFRIRHLAGRTERDVRMHQSGPSPVEDLVLLRTTVQNWAETAAKAVASFMRRDGSFWKDSKSAAAARDGEAPHITTSARAYIALLYADRLRDTSKGKKPPSWASDFGRLLAVETVGRSGRRFYEARKPRNTGDKIDPYDVNSFDIAHLVDFVQVQEYLKRFYELDFDHAKFFARPSAVEFSEGKTSDSETGTPSEKTTCDDLPPKSLVGRRLRQAIEQAGKTDETGVGFSGEVRFEESRPESRHYFATLHALRALHALGDTEINGLSAVVAGARSFAIEQAYYFQRGATHRQDPVRLAFAGTIYAIYDEHVDKDLCLAIVESLAAAQQENGSWPATHPVFRKSNTPWHIASHEVALCLSWLYFQPRVPDTARPLIVEMMRRYFINGVIPTFYRASSRKGDETAPTGSKLDGWQDDHTVSPDTTLGWATAIVCHFLAGFVQVLNDWINRRVIEELDLQLATERYLIDDTASSPSPRWARTETTPFVWPDLPPHGWAAQLPSAEVTKVQMEENWTDPLPRAATCDAIAKKVLAPILLNPTEQPQRDRCAGLMPGSPGTRKTSLVKEISKLARWPMVAVPASSIFEEGYDRMEARANRVFGLLNHLRACVIFFDEFEEFFLSRGEDEQESIDGEHDRAVTSKPQSVLDPSGKADTTDAYKSRTIAAFTTSAMLPRLQELHDKDRCLIFLATNYPKKLDAAIKRAGRFDFTITVNHPTLERLDEYFADLNQKSKKLLGLDAEQAGDVTRLLEVVREAIRNVAAEKSEKRIKFAVVEEALRSVRPVKGVRKEELLAKAVESIRKQIEASNVGNPPELISI